MRIIRTCLIFCILFVVALLLDATFLSYFVFADTSSVDVITIAVPTSCTLSGTGNNSHSATISNGTYQPNIGTTTLHAFCNDTSGFAIYAAGYTGNEIGATNSNKLVGASSNTAIETGLATTTGNPDVSNWAMKLAITQDSGDTSGTNVFAIDNSFNNYHVVPNTYTKVAHKNSATNMDSTNGGVKLTTTYAAYISKAQAADTYTGQVIYTLVHPANHAVPIFYNTNADDISEVTYLQEFAKVSNANRQSIVDSMVPEQQYTVTDSRDGKTYTIAKYQTGVDSNTNDPIYDVWMTKNLDLDLDSSRTYTNEDTDLGYNTTTGEYETASWSPVRSTYTSTSNHIHSWCNGGTWNTQEGYCESNYTPESYDPGNLYWNGTESGYGDWVAYYQTCNYSTSTPSCDQSKNPISTYVSTISSTPQYHLGNYYNWNAAVAMNDSSTHTTYNEIMEQSICPAGWTLPRIGNDEDTFYALWNQYNLTNSSYIDTNSNGQHDTNENALWTAPLYSVISGYYGGVLGHVGSHGFFWSPVVDGYYNARNAYFYAGGDVDPSNVFNRNFGFSIRCIARPVVYSEPSGSGSGGDPK